jgi:hypothetical protein
MRSSFSYWMEEVWMDILAQYFFQLAGSLVDQRTVRLGSGLGPKFVRVCR